MLKLVISKDFKDLQLSNIYAMLVTLEVFKLFIETYSSDLQPLKASVKNSRLGVSKLLKSIDSIFSQFRKIPFICWISLVLKLVKSTEINDLQLLNKKSIEVTFDASILLKSTDFKEVQS